MGYSSRKEMERLISDAFEESDPDWVASALVAMGRSASEDWEMPVLRSLFHADSVVRLEAIRAAGTLNLTRAVEPAAASEPADQPGAPPEPTAVAAVTAAVPTDPDDAVISAAISAHIDSVVNDARRNIINR
jgi:hypothetical protein